MKGRWKKGSGELESLPPDFPKGREGALSPVLKAHEREGGEGAQRQSALKPQGSRNGLHPLYFLTGGIEGSRHKITAFIKITGAGEGEDGSVFAPTVIYYFLSGFPIPNKV